MAMRSTGNSRPDVCVANLLACKQREVPYARSKGIDGDALDLPPGMAEGFVDESARDCLEVYEPRVDVEEMEFEIAGGGLDRYAVAVDGWAEEEEDD